VSRNPYRGGEREQLRALFRELNAVLRMQREVLLEVA
jgi:hypothetical protein